MGSPESLPNGLESAILDYCYYNVRYGFVFESIVVETNIKFHLVDRTFMEFHDYIHNVTDRGIVLELNA